MDDNDRDVENNWNYLSDVLNISNEDEDLVEDDNAEKKTAPKTNLGEEIQHIAEPNAELSPIISLRPGRVHIHGQFSQAAGRYVRSGLHVTDAIISDGTASARVIWWNQPYRASSIKRDVIYEVRGNYRLYRSRFQISNPKIRLLSEGCKPFERGEKG